MGLESGPVFEECQPFIIVLLILIICLIILSYKYTLFPNSYS